MATSFNYNIESIFTLGQGTAVIGWATDIDKPIKIINIKQVDVNISSVNLRKEGKLIRTQRADVSKAFDIVGNDAHGFVIWLPLLIEANNAISVSFDDNPENTNSLLLNDVNTDTQFLSESLPHSGTAIYQLALKHKATKLIFALLDTFEQNPGIKLPAIANGVEAGDFYIDYAFNLDNQGVVILGWQHFSQSTEPTLQLLSSRGELQVIDKIYPLSRPDVWESIKQKSATASINCGFFIYIDGPVDTQADYLLQLDFKHCSDFRKITFANKEGSLNVVRTMLEAIPSPHSLIDSIYHIFSSGLGKTIGAISHTHRKILSHYQEQQFGQAPDNPTISVIVPLYGRFDFMRHQLAHFVHDADFDNVDLIYVVDDPRIKEASLNTAISYHALFQKPFRVIWYDCNLGFAGANNIGVRAARGEKLLLMNSDIIPQQTGWLSELNRHYDSLPNAGIIGPLLQFADNSIQHAGMKAKRDPYLPGFLLNIHPGKGWEYPHTTEPSQQQLLTAACIFMSKQDYLEVGGFDEGYLIGDFEDSDLCLAIKKRGKNLWLTPAVRLWHLERQSQNIGTVSGFRQLITLYNGWRYHEKILAGEIANPETGSL